MNPQNQVEFVGSVHADPIAGAAWTRWKKGGRGQVRFWLAVSRELMGDGFDVFLCAIEPQTAPEVDRLALQLTAGRTVHLFAQARRVEADLHGMNEENSMTVIFVAETCGFDGAEPFSAHKVGIVHRRHHAHGKMAAAGDTEPELLEMAGGNK